MSAVQGRLVLLLCLFAAEGAHAAARSQHDAGAGEQLFASTGCSHCHGSNLAGSDRAPGLQDAGRRLKTEQIREQIEKGGTGMPAFGEVLSGDQVTALVDYLRRQRSKHPEKPAPAAR